MANEELDKELKESIAYFEQILDVLPGERTALEFLCVACAQLGDGVRSLKYALALAEVILREKDAEGAADLIEKLSGSSDPRAQEAVLKLQVLVTPLQGEAKAEKRGDWLSSALAPAAIQAELTLLKKLVGDGVLVKEAVQLAFDQLESMPPTDAELLVSALSILEKENLPGAADAVAAVADAAHAPPVPLEAFELSPGDVHKLPDRLIKVRGVIPFARLGSEWAVAVLNPLDETLKSEVAAVMGAKCHFFLAPPASIEKVLARLFGANDEVAAKTAAEATPAAESVAASDSAPADPAALVEPASAPAPAEPAPAEPVAPARPAVKPKLGIRRPPRK